MTDTRVVDRTTGPQISVKCEVLAADRKGGITRLTVLTEGMVRMELTTALPNVEKGDKGRVVFLEDEDTYLARGDAD